MAVVLPGVLTLPSSGAADLACGAQFLKRHKSLQHLLHLRRRERKDLLIKSVQGTDQAYLLRKADEKRRKLLRKNHKMSVAHCKGERRKSHRPGRGKGGWIFTSPYVQDMRDARIIASKLDNVTLDDQKAVGVDVQYWNMAAEAGAGLSKPSKRQLPSSAERSEPFKEACARVVDHVSTVLSRQKRDSRSNKHALKLKEDLVRRLSLPVSRLRASPDLAGICALRLRLFCDGHVIVVPDECGFISDAVERLAATGGVVEVAGPPLVPNDVIELRDPRVSIIATRAEGVDVRGACLYIQLLQSSSTQNICIQGLHNLRRVSILDCLHDGAIAFKNCDIFRFSELHFRYSNHLVWNFANRSGRAFLFRSGRRHEDPFHRPAKTAYAGWLNRSRLFLGLPSAVDPVFEVLQIEWPLCAPCPALPPLEAGKFWAGGRCAAPLK